MKFRFINTRYAQNLLKNYGRNKRIIFTGGVFDEKKLWDLRTRAILYFHGHSVGGTNPSLLQAMADGCIVIAHDNLFNRGVLGDDGLYFQTENDVCEIITGNNKLMKEYGQITENNFEKIRVNYSWDRVANEYEILIGKIIGNNSQNQISN